MKTSYFNEKTKPQVALVVRTEVKPHRQIEFDGLLKDFVENSRKEPGCLSYNVYQDLEQPTIYIFHEVWATQDDLLKHRAAYNFKYYTAKKSHLVARNYGPGLFERSDAEFPQSSVGSLVLFAKIKALPGKETELAEILTDLIAPTTAEKGCEHYELHKSILDPLKFLFHETWTTVEDWNDHMETKHIKDLLEILDDYVDGGIDVTKAKQIR
ncbi:MAG: antibiotic biosynthesis monooxygenase [Rikenellaceae bacterium]